MNLYIYKGENHKGKDGERLIHLAAQDYLGERKKIGEVKRTDNGKPYFEDLSLHFSISHSNGLWACVMAENNIGLDIQFEKKVNYERLSNRFFAVEEATYIKEMGMKSFFEIWTRKESFTKYTGKGFAKEGFSTYSMVTESNDVADNIEFEGKTLCFEEISYDLNKYISEGKNLFGVICTEHKEKIVYKEILELGKARAYD